MNNKDKSKIHIDTIGLNTIILLSTDLFPSNIDIKDYTNDKFTIELKDYLFNSRNLLVARTNRYIYDLNENEAKNLYYYMKNYINSNSEYFNQSEENNDNKKIKRRSKDNLRLWLENI